MKIQGQCHICGKKNVELTFEHIPPREAFNFNRAKLVTGEDILSVDNDPWDFAGLKYEQRQQGQGLYTLCSECNNNMGSWYAPAYIYVAKCINAMHWKHNLLTNYYYEFSIFKMKPLNFIKQVVSMFCSVNSTGKLVNDKQIRDFLLDKYNNSFDSSKYRIYMYLTTSGFSKICDITVKIHLDGNPEVISEISFYPLGFILEYNPTDSVKDYGVDITNFTTQNYDVEADVQFKISNRETNIIFPADFRSKEEIIECRELNKQQTQELFNELNGHTCHKK